MLAVRESPIRKGLGSVALVRRDGGNGLLPLPALLPPPAAAAADAAAAAAVCVAAVASSPEGASILRTARRLRAPFHRADPPLPPPPVLVNCSCRGVETTGRPAAAASIARRRASHRSAVLQCAYVASFIDITMATTVSMKPGSRLACLVVVWWVGGRRVLVTRRERRAAVGVAAAQACQ